MFRWFKVVSIAILSTLFLSQTARANSDSDVVLTVVNVQNSEKIAELTLEDLTKMEVVRFETNTIWTEGLQEFRGVELSQLLTALGVEAEQLKASAVNDYSVEIPVADAIKGGPIVAFQRNGEYMSLRDKGPLWIVYPYDSDPAYRNEAIYSRSVWQLSKITILR